VNQSYQVYGQSGLIYARITSSDFSQKPGQFTITRTQINEDYTIAVNVINSLSDFTSIDPLNESSAFTNTEFRMLPLDSHFIYGNNLDYSITPNANNFFKTKLVNELDVKFEFPAELEKKGRMFGQKDAISSF